jgi:integrase
MRGSIKSRKLANGRAVWDLVVDVGAGPSGKRRQHRKRGFATKAAARRELTTIQSSVDARSYVVPDRLTVGEYLSDWAAGVQVRSSTRSAYETHVRVHLAPRLGGLRLQELNLSSIQAAYRELSEAGLSPTTVRRVHATLHRSLSDATRRSLVVRNVAAQAELPKQVRVELRTWTGAELRTFLDHVREDRLFPAYLLAATTGLRRGEVLGLRWRETDLDAGRAAVVRALISVHHALSFSDPKTPRSRRSVPLAPEAVAALRVHRKRQLEERLAWGPAYEGTDLVFTREDGSPVHPDRFSKLFEQYARAAGVPPIRLHDVRHTFATLALQAGVPPKVVADILGHASVAFTMDTYSHAIPAMQEDAVAKVAGLVFR